MANPNTKIRNNPFSAPQFYYPSDLGSEGQEPYVVFDIRNSVAKDGTSIGSIALMLPTELSVSYRAGYEDAAMGVFGYSPPSLKGLMNKGWGAVKDAAESFLENPAAAKQAWSSVRDGFLDTADVTAVSTSARVQRDFGKIVNPHMAVLFQGMGFRSFPMTFSMVARNAEESDMIRNIIYTFKYHMHPSLPEDTTGNRFLLYPENFVIAFHSPAQQYLFKTSPCVLESMDVNYNGSSIPSFYSDTGAPVHIVMSLLFKETETLTKQRINQNY